MKHFSRLAICIASLLVSLSASAKENIDFVNVFIGTSATGHTTPAAAYPMGMVQPGPQTGNFNWKYTCGYNYDDHRILGFTQTKLSGTGCSDLGDLLMMPFCGTARRDDFSSSFSKATEMASPGYYGVTLDENKVKVDMTCSAHVALHRYEFLAPDAGVMIDFQTGQSFTEPSMHARIRDFEIRQIDDQTIVGYEKIQMWVTRRLYFAIVFSSPIISADTLPSHPQHRAPRIVYRFNMGTGDVLSAKVALSTVRERNALQNIAVDMPDWDFDSVLSENREKWSALMNLFDLKGTNEQKQNFYTSLYHLFFQPNIYSDVNGDFRAADDNVTSAPGMRQYSTLSLWDTFRAAQPLLTLIHPNLVSDIVNSMISHSEAQGFLPIWALWGRENYCMIGNHAVPVIVDAVLRGFHNINAEEAYREIRRSLTENHLNSDWDTYDRYGYYPFDIINMESVSRTLESGYDDYCAALLAQKLGRKEDAEFFMKRSEYYKNLYDPETGLMRPKDSQGHWREPFSKFALSHASSSGGDYTEGNAWQYTWHVLQDIPGLISLMGGNEPFTARLDSLFSLSVSSDETGVLHDVTGLIGQYAHGNEPSHHVAYLFTMAGKPWRTAELIREIFDRFYSPRPDGLCGNDDCGQMSAWYIFSAMGFYPVNPVAGEYVIGAPQIPRITMNLPNGKQFTVIAKNLSKKNKYVKSVSLNGNPLTGNTITYEQIMAGGTLTFTMTKR